MAGSREPRKRTGPRSGRGPHRARVGWARCNSKIPWPTFFHTTFHISTGCSDGYFGKHLRLMLHCFHLEVPLPPDRGVLLRIAGAILRS